MENKKIIIILLIFFVASLLTIYSTVIYIDDPNIVVKHSFFYLISLAIILILSKININFIYKYSFIIYIILNIFLLLVLFLGKEINGSRAWFEIPKIGTIQPSEFMKIGIILLNATTIKNHKGKDLKLILKIFVITLIPSILTFLEPDTGAVIIYFIISLVILMTSNISKKWFYIGACLLSIFIISFLGLYYLKQDLFIKFLGSEFFYRFDRITNWLSKEGMQLENSLISIGSTKIFGNGLNNILIYFPEPHTDFIFASFISCFGLISGIILILLIVSFDFTLLDLASKNKNITTKYIVIGTVSALMYQQIQNISMTMGLLPITGITLPFISSGGSSLLSYSLLIGIILNTKKRYKSIFN